MRLGFLSWDAAQRSCESSAVAAHLANIKTNAEFQSTTASLQERYGHLFLLWTALNDHEVAHVYITQTHDLPTITSQVCLYLC